MDAEHGDVTLDARRWRAARDPWPPMPGHNAPKRLSSNEHTKATFSDGLREIIFGVSKVLGQKIRSEKGTEEKSIR